MPRITGETGLPLIGYSACTGPPSVDGPGVSGSSCTNNLGVSIGGGVMDFLIYHLGTARRPIRAARYSREIPSLYRVVGANYWQRGLTINISESGVLLQAASPLALRTRLEMTFQVSEPIGTFQVGQVACIGEVVRHAQPTEASPFPRRRQVGGILGPASLMR